MYLDTGADSIGVAFGSDPAFAAANNTGQEVVLQDTTTTSVTVTTSPNFWGETITGPFFTGSMSLARCDVKGNAIFCVVQ